MESDYDYWWCKQYIFKLNNFNNRGYFRQFIKVRLKIITSSQNFFETFYKNVLTKIKQYDIVIIELRKRSKNNKQ